MSVQRIPTLLSKIATLTTIRDIELFELSLLKTLADLLKINQLSLYKANPNLDQCLLTVYTENHLTDDQTRCQSESSEVYTSEINTPSHIKAAQIWIQTTKKPYLKKKDAFFQIVYPVTTIQEVDHLIAFELEHALTGNEMLIVASLLNISHNFQSLLDENQKDKLTGLLNRQTFETNINKIQTLSLNFQDLLQDEWDGIERRRTNMQNNQFCLAMIDIDNFKWINDRFGHIIGDEVLLLLSYLMKQSFRPRDLLFRFGGEEFVVIFAMYDKEHAFGVLERFREMIAHYRFPQINTVTVSIGATLLPQAGLHVTEVIGRADMALYHAKNNGKNQVHIHENLIEQGLITNNKKTGTIDLF